MTKITPNSIMPIKSKLAVVVGATAILGAAALFSADGLRASTALSTNSVAATQTMPGAALPVNIADVVERVSAAVVSVHVTQNRRLANAGPQDFPFEEFFGRFFDEETRKQFGRQFRNAPPSAQPPPQGLGSGFVIDKSGLIVTNHHVIENADKISITMKDGKKLDAKLVASDPKTDLALLKVKAGRDLPSVKFGRSQDMRVGDWVVTIGNPFGLSQTATTGIISARHRNIGAGPFDDFLQIDAPIHQGNSGGPAFNLKGEVIGVNTAIFSPSGGNVGIGFAIPAKLAEKIIADLRADGRVERGWLGVHIQGVTDELAQSLELKAATGALVSKVSSGSPAAKAGLKRGDVILAVNGETVEGVRNLPIMVAGLKPGTDAEAKIWRDGKPMTIKLRMGAMPAADEVAAVAEDASVQGLELAALDRRTRRTFRIDEDVRGVVITGVKPGSAAARNGLNPGDVIVTVGHVAVSSPDDVAKKIAKAMKQDRKGLLLLVNRDSRERFVALSLRDA